MSLEIGTIYLVQAGKYQRVGCCKLGKLQSSIRTLELANPEMIVLLADFESADYLSRQRQITKRLEPWKVKGDWFELPPEMLRDLSWFGIVEEAEETSRSITFRLPVSEFSHLAAYCAATGKTQTWVLRNSIRSLEIPDSSEQQEQDNS